MIAAASSKDLFSLNIVTIERSTYLSDPFEKFQLWKGEESCEMMNFEGQVSVWICVPVKLS